MVFFFAMFLVRCNSCYNLVHILPASYSKSAPIPQFSQFRSVNQALATVWCAFRDLIFPKVLRAWQSFYHFEVQIERSKSLVHFLTTISRSRPATADTETLLWRPQEPHYPKKPESAFTCEFTRFWTVTLRSYLMMGSWHDDVVDMMVWMLTTTTVRNSDFFKLNFPWRYSSCDSLILDCSPSPPSRVVSPHNLL